MKVDLKTTKELGRQTTNDKLFFCFHLADDRRSFSTSWTYLACMMQSVMRAPYLRGPVGDICHSGQDANPRGQDGCQLWSKIACHPQPFEAKWAILGNMGDRGSTGLRIAPDQFGIWCKPDLPRYPLRAGPIVKFCFGSFGRHDRQRVKESKTRERACRDRMASLALFHSPHGLFPHYPIKDPSTRGNPCQVKLESG